MAEDMTTMQTTMRIPIAWVKILRKAGIDRDMPFTAVVKEGLGLWAQAHGVELPKSREGAAHPEKD